MLFYLYLHDDSILFLTLPLKLEYINHMHQTCYIYNLIGEPLKDLVI